MPHLIAYEGTSPVKSSSSICYFSLCLLGYMPVTCVNKCYWNFTGFQEPEKKRQGMEFLVAKRVFQP